MITREKKKVGVTDKCLYLAKNKCDQTGVTAGAVVVRKDNTKGICEGRRRGRLISYLLKS